MNDDPTVRMTEEKIRNSEVLTEGVKLRGLEEIKQKGGLNGWTQNETS